MTQVLYLRVLCTSLKAFFQNIRKKSPKILLKTIRGRSDHNLIKIREKRTKKIFIGNLCMVNIAFFPAYFVRHQTFNHCNNKYPLSNR